MIYFSTDFLKNYELFHIEKFEKLIQILGTEEQEKLRYNILNPISFLLIAETTKTEKNVQLINECLQYLLNNQIDSKILTIQNNQLYMPPADTRGESLNYTEVNQKDEEIFFDNLSIAKKILGYKWEELISIVKVVTFVTITGKEELLTHFSGSNSDLWGAIHMNKNLGLLNIIECITHESSHHWLNLLEFYNKEELIIKGWDDNSYISPWRRDKRPLMGVLHGVYVFGNVFIVYNKLSNIHTEYDTDRMYYIGNQVKRGYEILQDNINLISMPTMDFIEKSRLDFLNVYNYLDQLKNEKFYNIVLSQEIEKKK